LTGSVTIADTIRAEALKLGFSVARFAELPQVWAASERLAAFVEAGLHGDMAWMEETLERRKHPRHMWSEARGALVLGYNYGPEADPLERLNAPAVANLSVYARGDDYHELIKGKLKQLAGWMVAKTGGDVKVFVDTAPLMEKPLAHLAGLGWQGKHTNLVSREFGSWLFLGVILTDHVIAADPPETDHCGSCHACLDICPTMAFIGPYRLDARKCLSYLTIEHKGPWPQAYRRAMGNRVYGCDDCLAACPWNKFAQATHETRLQARPGFDDLKLDDMARLDDAAFRELFRKSPVKRVGRDAFLRNVHYALGNAGAGSVEALKVGVGDDSALVRGAAVWGLRQVLPEAEFAALRDEHLPGETDAEVRAEWEGTVE
jgi:epoxyqueuosine reductase